MKIVDGKITKASTAADTCSCTFHRSMKLPCKHIFAYRDYHQQPLFDETLAHSRWHLSYYKKSHGISSESGSPESENTNVIVTSSEVRQPKPKTQHQKFKAAHALTLRMATIISEGGTREFNNKMTEAKKLLQYWENGLSVDIIGKQFSDDDDKVSDSDDYGHMSCEDFDNDDPDVSGNIVIDTEIEVESTMSSGSGEGPSCSGWSGRIYVRGKARCY